MDTLELLIANLDAARRYTVGVIDRIDPVDWFRMPPGGVTHVAWQVGHLAVAEYSLAVERIRAPRPEDAALFPESFRPLFGKGSTPTSDASAYPPAEAIRDVFDRVHRQVMAEIPGLTDAELDAPPLKPSHPRFSTRAGSLLWCGQHEFVHAGQITLIRRLLGGEPNW
jgi:hypothetical protein